MAAPTHEHFWSEPTHWVAVSAKPRTEMTFQHCGRCGAFRQVEVTWGKDPVIRCVPAPPVELPF
jgi:hypothetical protein